MENDISVIFKEPGKSAEVRQIPNTLGSLQSAVGGYIEVLRFAEDCAVIINEEGKLRGLPVNFGFLGDVLCGNVVFVGVSGEEFCSLNEKAERFLVDMFKKMEWVERGDNL